MARKKVLPPTYLLIAIVAIILIRLIFPKPFIIPAYWNLFGIIFLILGVVINLVADNSFKKHDTPVKPFEESNALITSGIYRLSRHPMYLGFALILFGLCVLSRSLFPFLVIPIFVVLMEINFIRIEETMLSEKFGKAWDEYKKKVRRWV